jgi:hypothetical protein
MLKMLPLVLILAACGGLQQDNIEGVALEQLEDNCAKQYTNPNFRKIHVEQEGCDMPEGAKLFVVSHDGRKDTGSVLELRSLFLMLKEGQKEGPVFRCDKIKGDPTGYFICSKGGSTLGLTDAYRPYP